MNILMSGNPEFGIAEQFYKLYPNTIFASRTSGYDLTVKKDQEKFAELAVEMDVVIICSALWKFNQTVLLDIVCGKCIESGSKPHIITIGSTTDRVKKGGVNLYHVQKKALRDYSNSLSLNGVWGQKSPKVSYISVGSLSNSVSAPKERKLLPIEKAAEYIKWVIEQPKWLNINEISIDPMQSDFWTNNE